MTRPIKLVSILLVLAIAYSVGWYVMDSKVETQVPELLAAQQANGIDITIGSHHKSGFPFALRVELGDIGIKGPAGLAITAESAWVGVAPNELNLTFKQVSVSEFLKRETPLSVDTISLHLDQPATPPTAHTQPGGHAIVNATNITVPQPAIPGLGNTIARLTMEATVMGKPPRLTKEALTAWSNDGGTVEVKELSTEWGPLGLGIGGTLSLDDSLQPLAAFDGKIAGYNETLTALADSGAIKQRSASLIAMGLGLIAKPEGPDNTPTVSVPVSIQNRTLYLASFKIMTLPEVRLY